MLAESPAESLLELGRLALLSSTLDAGIAPTLRYLTLDTPALGAAYLERSLPSSAPTPDRWFSPQGREAARVQAVQPSSRFQLRAHAGTPPSAELTGVMLTALSSPHAPLVAASPGGRTLSLALERGPDGVPLAVLSLYSFSPYGLDPDAEERFLRVAEDVVPLLTRLRSERQLERERDAAYRALGMALELRGADPHGHTERVATLSVRLGRVLGYPESDLSALRWGAYLHDVGKLGIPDGILLKSGKLELAEWQIMHLHPEDGVRFLANLPDLPTLTSSVVREHHEHWDGSGYPRGLTGKDISLEGRLFAVVDAYDALTTRRLYREAIDPLEALEEIAVRSYGHFDPEVVEAFVSLFERRSSL